MDRGKMAWQKKRETINNKRGEEEGE